MYYHEIDFFNQAGFFIYSFVSGFISGLIYSLCDVLAFNKAFRYATDIIFSVSFLQVVIFTNIIFQESALRFYEITGSFLGLFFYLISIKKYVNKFFIFIKRGITDVLIKPSVQIFKLINSFIKKILQYTASKVYNLYKLSVKNFGSLFKERFSKNNGGEKKEKTA